MRRALQYAAHILMAAGAFGLVRPVSAQNTAPSTASPYAGRSLDVSTTSGAVKGRSEINLLEAPKVPASWSGKASAVAPPVGPAPVLVKPAPVLVKPVPPAGASRKARKHKTEFAASKREPLPTPPVSKPAAPRITPQVAAPPAKPRPTLYSLPHSNIKEWPPAYASGTLKSSSGPGPVVGTTARPPSGEKPTGTPKHPAVVSAHSRVAAVKQVSRPSGQGGRIGHPSREGKSTTGRLSGDDRPKPLPARQTLKGTGALSHRSVPAVNVKPVAHVDSKPSAPGAHVSTGVITFDDEPPASKARVSSGVISFDDDPPPAVAAAPVTVAPVQLRRRVQAACGPLAREVAVVKRKDRSVWVMVKVRNRTAEKVLTPRILQIPEMSAPGVHLEMRIVP